MLVPYTRDNSLFFIIFKHLLSPPTTILTIHIFTINSKQIAKVLTPTLYKSIHIFLYHTTISSLFLSFISIVHRRFKPKIDLFLIAWIFFIFSIRISRFHFPSSTFPVFDFSISYYLSVTSYILLFRHLSLLPSIS